MDKQQAIDTINQLLDEYRCDENNWEGVPNQCIWYEQYEDDGTYAIEGTAQWEECCLTRTVGDEEIPTEFFEPTLSRLDCRLKCYDINGNEVYNEQIDECDL